MTKKIDKNEFYLTMFNKSLGDFIKDAVNRQVKDYIDTRETVVNETTIFMIKKGEKRTEIEVDYDLKKIIKYFLNVDTDGVIKEIETLVMSQIVGKLFE